MQISMIAAASLRVASFVGLVGLAAACAAEPSSASPEAPRGYGYEFSPDPVFRRPLPEFPQEAVVNGRVPPEWIQMTFRMAFPRFLACYEAPRSVPARAGTLSLHFVATADGEVRMLDDLATDMDDPELRSCVKAAVQSIAFPARDGADVTVIYPLVFGGPVPILPAPKAQ